MNKTVKPIKYQNLMKEKIKKMFQYIYTWKFVMWLNIVFATFHLVVCFIHFNIIPVCGVVWHLGYALVSYYLQKYEEQHIEDAFCVVQMVYHNAEQLRQLNRYKTRYGELPPDEPQAESPQAEAPESKKPETETPQVDMPSVKAEKPKRPAVNPGKPHRTSSGAPRKPRTRKSKEEL